MSINSRMGRLGVGAVVFANANREDFLLSRRLVDLDLHLLGQFK